MPDSIESVKEALNKFIEQTITFILDEDDAEAVRMAIILTSNESNSAADLLNKHKLTEDLDDAARSPGTLIQAAIFALIARRNLAAGKLVEALEDIIKANRRLGAAKTTKSEIRITKTKTSNKLRNAAKAKAAKLIPVKAEVERLLKDRRPKKGWESISAAVSKIENDVNAFSAANGFKLSDDNANKLLTTWIGEKDSQLRKTFLDNASLKARSRLAK